MLIHRDSTTTIAKIENHYYNAKRRQIKMKHNIVKDCIPKGVLRVDHVYTGEILTGHLTKD